MVCCMPPRATHRSRRPARQLDRRQDMYHGLLDHLFPGEDRGGANRRVHAQGPGGVRGVRTTPEKRRDASPRNVPPIVGLMLSTGRRGGLTATRPSADVSEAYLTAHGFETRGEFRE
jgi:hypothetical protein